MPEGAPEKLNADESQRVAAFIYDAFYSPVAQVRNQPARVELSRLTVRQYQNSIADLIGSFRKPGEWKFDSPLPQDGQPAPERGLAAGYYKAREPRGDKAIERVDREVKFDFGEEAPAEEFEAHQFSIRWEGSVLAPETGDYEFIVRTEHAARLWVNDPRRAADRRLGEVGQRHRVSRSRSACSAAGPIRCGWSSRRPSRASTTPTRTRTSRRPR